MVRLIDAGEVSGPRSQALYHGLAYARTEATPDTVVLATPRDPYVCIGFHQDVEREIDLEHCREQAIPVLRRETGGGAVFIDRDQLFVQWIMGADRLPARVDRRYEIFAEPLVRTYRAHGIEAVFRPINDVHVDGRKIVGTGAAHIGNAEVVIGNVIFDFDTEVMTRVLRVPSAAFRDQLRRSLELYMTSMRRELGAVPDRAAVAARYVEQCAAVLGVELVAGELTEAEHAAIEAAEARLTSEAFLHREGGLRRRGVKIHEDVYVVESTLVATGGTVRLTARTGQEYIEEVTVAEESGAATRALEAVALALRGVALRAESVREVVHTLEREGAIDGASVPAWIDAVLALRRGPV